MIDEDTLEFVRGLADISPVAHALREQHKDENFGDVLPYVFLATFAFTLAEKVRPALQDDKAFSDQLKVILEWIEQAYAKGSDEVRNLITVGFLESLPLEGEDGDELRELLGPHLKTKLIGISRVSNSAADDEGLRALQRQRGLPR